jgi:hypothetical protein
MTKADLHHLVEDLPDDAVDGTAAFLKQVALRRIDPDQFWFWSREWQAKEREVEDSLARGEPGTVYESDESFLAALEARTKPSES